MDDGRDKKQKGSNLLTSFFSTYKATFLIFYNLPHADITANYPIFVTLVIGSHLSQYLPK